MSDEDLREMERKGLMLSEDGDRIHSIREQRREDYARRQESLPGFDGDDEGADDSGEDVQLSRALLSWAITGQMDSPELRDVRRNYPEMDYSRSYPPEGRSFAEHRNRKE